MLWNESKNMGRTSELHYGERDDVVSTAVCATEACGHQDPRGDGSTWLGP